MNLQKWIVYSSEIHLFQSFCFWQSSVLKSDDIFLLSKFFNLIL